MTNFRQFNSLIAANVTLLATCSVLTAMPVDAREQRLYVIASTANLREEPTLAGKVVKQLAINTEVETLEERWELTFGQTPVESRRRAVLPTPAGEWVFVQTPAESRGWIRRDLLDTHQATTNRLIEKYKKTSKQDMATRQMLAERMVALEPANVSHLNRLASILEEQGKSTASDEVRLNIDFIRGEHQVVDPAEPVPIFVLQGATITPITMVYNGKIGELPPDTPEATKTEDEYIKRYFRIGRRYNLYVNGANIGNVSVVGSINPENINPYGLRDPTNAHVTVNTSKGAAPVERGIVTSALFRNNEQRVHRRPTMSELKTLTELAKDEFRKSRIDPKYNESTEDYRQARVRELNETAITELRPIQVLVTNSGRNVQEVLIGSFQVGKRNIESNSETSYMAFLIAERSDTGALQQTYAHVSGGGGDCATFEYKFLDQLDLNDDGIDEIITSGLYWESSGYTVLQKQSTGWQIIVGGGEGGC